MTPRFSIGAAILLAILPAMSPARAEVVRPAPGFSFPGEKSRAGSRPGSPPGAIVLVIADSPDSRPFRRQAKEIAARLRFFRNRKTALAVAFTEGGALSSDSPFVLVNGARQVAADFEMHKSRFGVFVIGPDGNLDLRTARVLSGQRLLDVIDNSFLVQAGARKS